MGKGWEMGKEWENIEKNGKIGKEWEKDGNRLEKNGKRMENMGKGWEKNGKGMGRSLFFVLPGSLGGKQSVTIQPAPLVGWHGASSGRWEERFTFR